MQGQNLLPYRKVTTSDRWLWKNKDTLHFRIKTRTSPCIVRGRTNNRSDLSVPCFRETTVKNVSNSGTCTAEPLPASGGFEENQPAAVSKWNRWRKSGAALVDYLLDARVPTSAFRE